MFRSDYIKPEEQLRIFQFSESCGLAVEHSGCEFDPHPKLDGSGFKRWPGSIPTHNSGSLKKNKKIQVAKWGTPKKYLKKRGHQKNI